MREVAATSRLCYNPVALEGKSWPHFVGVAQSAEPAKGKLELRMAHPSAIVV